MTERPLCSVCRRIWLLYATFTFIFCPRSGGDGLRAGAGRATALIGRIADATVFNNAARQAFEALWSGEASPVDARGCA